VRPGERVDARFEIVSEAGRGGMGTVFRARDRKTRRDVALKVLSSAAMRSVARFELEAAILAEVRHPNIVEYVAHGATPDGLHYLVMGWVEGETLAQRLHRTGLDARDTLALARALLTALIALHARSVVHRDIKPSNIMLGDGDRVTLVDLGVARRTDKPGRLTRTGLLVGTAGYMAPEQVRGWDAIDGRTDLFALGCVLYECLTGFRAFTGDTALAARAKVLVQDPLPMQILAPSLPDRVVALVMALLQRAPEQRPAGADAALRALDAIGELAPAAPPSRTRDLGALRTITAAPTAVHVCALVVSWSPDDAADPAAYASTIARLANATVEPIEGGLIMLHRAAPSAAVRLALAIAAEHPAALIAVAGADSTERAIDLGARLIEALELDDRCVGVWLAADDAARLGDGYRTMVAGDRVRVLDARSPAGA